MSSAQIEGSKLELDDGRIVIGLVNNMPDAALHTTEQQFRKLLSETPIGERVQFRTFFLPEIPRTEAARQHFMRHYEPIDALWESRIDGLIVTGAEPRALLLTEEVYWETLTKLVDWAEDHTVSTIWSCLAAHATIQHLDGIHRMMLPRKLSGVFECEKVTDHRILAGVPSQWEVPHSRYNGLPEEQLEQMGYRVLSRSKAAGADIFVREQGSLFVFLNGHPEYRADALFREYRRDVTRFLSGAHDEYPEVPDGYFADDTTRRLAAFRQRAMQHRHLDLGKDLPLRGSADERLPHAWYDLAVLIFGNWLAYISAHRPLSTPLQAYAATVAQAEPDALVAPQS